jgi:hypothetical protein
VEELISTLLLPTERPPVPADIKRSLLVFDQVHLADCNDRELIEPAAFMQMLTPIPMPIFFGNDGPVLPMGKLPGYDEQYEATLKECDPAIRQGSLVRRAQPQLMTSGFGLGSPPLPKDWAGPGWVIGNFLQLARNTDVLRAACSGLPREEHLRRFDLGAIAPGGRALRAPGGASTIAEINDGSLSPDVAAAIQRMAAARVGSAVKYVGSCHKSGLHPSSNDPGMLALLDHIQKTAGQTLAAVLGGLDDAELLRRVLRVERVLFAHELPDMALAGLTVEQVLRLRTKAWGRAGEGRTALFRAVRQLADQEPDDGSFDRAVREAIEKYRSTARDLNDEWKRLGGHTAVALAALPVGNILQSIFALPWGFAVPLAAIGLAGLALSKGVSEVVSILRKREDLVTSPGKAIVAPFAFVLQK